MDKKISEILAERGLASHMNDTKWRELCTGVYELPFAPAYQVKLLCLNEPCPLTFESNPTSLGDWAKTPEAALGIHIEWIKVASRYKRSIGQLIAPQIYDCSEQFRSLLVRLRLPFVESDGFFTIYGHSHAIDFDVVQLS